MQNKCFLSGADVCGKMRHSTVFGRRCLLHNIETKLGVLARHSVAVALVGLVLL